MDSCAAFFQARHDLLQFCTEQQKLLFQLLCSGKRGFFIDDPHMEPHHVSLMFMLWIYCYATVWREGMPTDLFYVSTCKSAADAARNLFHGIGHLVIEEKSHYDHEKLHRQFSTTLQVGNCTVWFISAQTTGNAAYHAASGAIVLCDNCKPFWAIDFHNKRKPPRSVYGVLLARSE